MQGGQFRSGVHAQFVGQLLAQFGVHGQRFGLPPGPVQRTQLDGAQPLPQRVADRQLAQVPDQRVVFTQIKSGLGERLQGSETLLAKVFGRGAEEHHVAQVGEGFPVHSARAPVSRSALVRGSSVPYAVAVRAVNRWESTSSGPVRSRYPGGLDSTSVSAPGSARARARRNRETFV